MNAKQQFQAYREQAKQLYQDVGRVESEHIHIPDYANVQITEDGGFVDVVVWVPKKVLDSACKPV